MSYYGDDLGPGLVRLHFLSPYESAWVEIFATRDLRRLYQVSWHFLLVVCSYH